jgi:hypothetical protein
LPRPHRDHQELINGWKLKYYDIDFKREPMTKTLAELNKKGEMGDATDFIQ